MVPELPASRLDIGVLKACNPRPRTRMVFCPLVMSTPSCCRQESVLRGSAASKKPLISDSPSARDAIINERWEIDLSPGSVTVP